ncbi:hypothetical protein [Actinacidiphila sp. ITFR-21]|uniref:hypothetical protein n=1 Tax=Actinacidiphila sp. ITFR-21 TaxID=3075199 RepID=UPI00288BDFFF|nr:hypothetical protein [Streptomyces sp. ITFR-21]WNI16007.1 hypothetical protein RLT57_11045 [Streptomyces sp. ITFR-21]
MTPPAPSSAPFPDEPPAPHEWRHGGPDPYPYPYPYAYGAFGPYLPPRPADPDRDPHAYLAPLAASVLGVPLMLISSAAVLISPMATDSCTADGCHALYTALLLAPCVLGLSFVALALAWALPRRRRHRAQRYAAAAAVPLLALAPLLIYVNLPAAS